MMVGFGILGFKEFIWGSFSVDQQWQLNCDLDCNDVVDIKGQD